MADETNDKDAEARKKDRMERWERDEKMRAEITRIQHEEMLVLHAEFPERQARLIAIDELRMADMRSVIAHREDMKKHGDEVLAAFELNNAALERIAAALERMSTK
jgi:hypothetical protein